MKTSLTIPLSPSSQQIEIYRWKGVTALGKKRSGRLLANSPEQALQRLSQQKLMITEIKQRPLWFHERWEQRVTSKDILLLINQISTMLSSGLALMQVIELMINQSKQAGMLQLLLRLKDEIDNGSTLAQAMSTSHNQLAGLISEFIYAGEISGQLTDAFQRLSTYLAKQQQLRAKVKKAAIYPSVVLGVSLLLAYLLLTQVIPKFEAMFNSLGAKLPWFTQLIVNLSHGLQSWGYWLFLGLTLSSLGLKALYRRQEALRYFSSRLGRAIPVVGPIRKKATVARFCQTLAATYRCGIPILNAIETAIRCADDLCFQYSVEKLTSQISTGMPLYQALHHCEIFPDLVIQLIMVGEESGNLEQSLQQVAQHFEQEVDNNIENLEKLLEPLVIVLLGLIVGSLVIAMYLPIFNLMSILG